MNWDLILILTAVMLFAYWLNYLMGSPLADNPNDVDPKAILFSFPGWLGERKLKKFGLYKAWHKAMFEELNHTSEEAKKYQLRQDFKRDGFIKGREFFTWERSLLCPICFHWWLTVIIGAIFLAFDLFNARADFFIAAFVYLALHLFIRKIA